MAPFAVVSPLAGVFVDRWPVKRTMIASDLIRGVLVLGLLFVNDLYLVYAILFTMSAVSAFFVPAQSVASANSCFLYDSFSFFFSASLVMTLTIDRQAVASAASAVWDSMRQGFRFIFTHPTISFVILAMTMGVVVPKMVFDRLTGRTAQPKTWKT